MHLNLSSGLSVLQAFSGTFTVSQDLQHELPLYNGEKVLTASVDFDDAESRTFFFTESGTAAPAEILLGGRN